LKEKRNDGEWQYTLESDLHRLTRCREFKESIWLDFDLQLRAHTILQKQKERRNREKMRDNETILQTIQQQQYDSKIKVPKLWLAVLKSASDSF